MYLMKRLRVRKVKSIVTTWLRKPVDEFLIMVIFLLIFHYTFVPYSSYYILLHIPISK